MSQLDLATAASTTPRYMSFVETGRSQPSREMVLRLAAALDVPLRDRNGLLVAAGFAPIYPEHDLEDPAIDRVMAALDRVLDQHAPYPAVVMNRRWDVVRVNAGAAHLFAGLCAPDPVPDPANVLQLMLEPGPVRSRGRELERGGAVAPRAGPPRGRRRRARPGDRRPRPPTPHRRRCGGVRRRAALDRPARAGHRRAVQLRRHHACAGSRSSRPSGRPSTSPLRSYASKRSSRPTTTPRPAGAGSSHPPRERSRDTPLGPARVVLSASTVRARV